MKRTGNLKQLVCNKDNIELADQRARRNKTKSFGVQQHDLNKEEENSQLLASLINQTYHTSKYDKFTIYEPKEREISRLPYFPDRICHHALMNVLESVWTKKLVYNTYACLKGKGIHALNQDLTKVLRSDVEGTKYCLKLDIRKFYPSINHEILKYDILASTIKDNWVLTTLFDIVDSAPGVPIGNYLSLFFANLYLYKFDHWIKEECKVKYYFRYADDIVILSDDKEFLRNLLIAIKFYLHSNLKLELKGNYQVFPVVKRGIDFVGYKFYHTHTLLRKSIKNKILKLINKGLSKEELVKRLQSYFGWCKYCNSKHLLQIIEEVTNIHYSNFVGKEAKISNFYNKNIYIVEVVSYSKYYKIHFIYKNRKYSAKSTNKKLFNIIKNFPIHKFKLVKIC